MNLPYDTDVVVCPNCGSEYQLHVTHCIDCGTPTQSGWTFTDLHRKQLARRGFSLPPESQDSIAVRGGDLQWAESFGSFLEEHGIPWRLEVIERTEFPTKRFYYFVHVAEGDLGRAVELDQEYLLLENPGLAAEFIDLPSTDQCPACGSRVSPESAECQSCGLALNGPISDGAEEESEWEAQNPATRADG
jgi:hypothetical protein